MEFNADQEFMPLQVFEGGNGDLVIMQEYSTPSEEKYLRVITSMSNAEELCVQIMAIAKKAREK